MALRLDIGGAQYFHMLRLRFKGAIKVVVCLNDKDLFLLCQRETNAVAAKRVVAREILSTLS